MKTKPLAYDLLLEIAAAACAWADPAFDSLEDERAFEAASDRLTAAVAAWREHLREHPLPRPLTPEDR